MENNRIDFLKRLTNASKDFFTDSIDDDYTAILPEINSLKHVLEVIIDKNNKNATADKEKQPKTVAK